ncbi:MAG: hypothetical protein ACWGON_08295, partial [Gemmatimonadota bacterium]
MSASASGADADRASVFPTVVPGRFANAIQPPSASARMPARASSPDGHRLAAGCATIASISPVAAASVFRIPSGVLSNAQASTTAIGNPRIDS